MINNQNNILVTGGAGYIGSHIVENLVKTKNKVIIIDNLVTGYKRLIIKKVKFIKADIKNKQDLIKIIKNNKIDSIIHLAAYLNVSEAEKNKKSKIFLIDPSKKKSVNNKLLINKLGIKNNKIFSFVAPFYNPNNLNDKNLLKHISKFKPNVILINIGGGTQEVLGSYLKSKLKFKCKIICTGAAISFFTKDQAPINDFIDKFYLGWLIRIIFNPLQFYKRYLYALKLINIVRKDTK